MAVNINPEARRAVELRAQGICERCGPGDPSDLFDQIWRQPVHMHHLTYERAGCELPEDLEYICLDCHMKAHPDKQWEIFCWEVNRHVKYARTAAQIAGELEEKAQENFEDEPALNLGHYSASGYCLEDVEEEERRRANG